MTTSPPTGSRSASSAWLRASTVTVRSCAATRWRVPWRCSPSYRPIPCGTATTSWAAEHSWIVLPSRHVLDAYAVGRHPPVQLVAVVTTIPKRFVERDLGIAVDQETVDWLLSETSMRHSQCWDSDREGA